MTDEEINREILAAIESLERLVDVAVTVTTSDESLSATWKLLWTTEKETLFIFKQAPFFGTKAGETFQTIDVQGGTLSNTITFPPSGMFDVSASIHVASAQRVNFQFTGARLVTASWTLPVPPFGQGWFDNTYIDNEIRISRDSRGDVLITERSTEM
ncbi:hypothetical protein CLOM_g18469 [Closterium sp. NIES-68]|nr:hypothetical protein CLOM_g18469 [Closterium sp. NIES-68]GJP69525.1 hypothetical protein CLOP_g529 [Closterium sp. NIES-67]